MSIIVLNLILALPFYFYAIKNYSRINVFSPFVLPYIYFHIYYFVPSSMLVFEGVENSLEVSHIIYGVGVLSFFVGVLISRRLKKGSQFKLKDIKYSFKRLAFFWVIGVLFLMIYGYKSGVLLGFISGESIEGIRRSNEIGLGFIKEPGYFFVVFSTLFYFSRKRTCFKVGMIIRPCFFLLLLVIILIFMCTGHKTLTLLPVLILFGMFSKIRQVNILLLMASIVLGVIFLGVINEMRSNTESSLVSKSLVVLTIYEANYKTIVNMINDKELELAYGEEYLPGLVSIVPRFLWKEKPLSYDYVLKEKLNRSFSGGGLPPTIVGSFYLNFSIIGVLICLLLTGYLYQTLYFIFINNGISYSPIILYLMFILINPSQLFYNLTMAGLFLFTLFVFSKQRLFVNSPRDRNI